MYQPVVCDRLRLEVLEGRGLASNRSIVLAADKAEDDQIHCGPQKAKH